MHTSARLVSFVLAAAVVSACGSSPAQPSAAPAAAASSAALTASVTVPRPLSPATGAQIRNLDQPVTLVVKNAVVTKPGDTTYTFEVATDAAFAGKVQTKDGVAEGASGQTSVTLATLAPATDYYWHARAQGGGTTGVFGATSKFTVGPAIVLNAPVAVSPLSGAQTTTRPTFTVVNATRTGPAGAITYKFEIAANAAFSPVTATGTSAEGQVQTAFTLTTDLAANQTYYWRATALDQANGIVGTPSVVQTFTTSLVIDLHKTILAYPGTPSNVADWPVTATITAVEQDGNASLGGPMCISFTTTDDWPSVPFFGDPSVPVYANQWYFANIGGQWYAGPGEYLRSDRGVCKTGQGTNSIGPDGGWISPMNGWAPRVGELVGYMMSTPARAGMRSIDERSNIVLQPWVDTSVSGASAARIRK